MKELELNVVGMKCMGCENRIKNTISQIREVKEVNASHENGKVNIKLKKNLTDELKQNIIETIERMDFEVER